MEWILILAIYTGGPNGSGANGRMSTEVIYGFTSSEACQKAGKQFKQQYDQQEEGFTTSKYACIERPTRPLPKF